MAAALIVERRPVALAGSVVLTLPARSPRRRLVAILELARPGGRASIGRPRLVAVAVWAARRFRLLGFCPCGVASRAFLATTFRPAFVRNALWPGFKRLDWSGPRPIRLWPIRSRAGAVLVAIRPRPSVGVGASPTRGRGLTSGDAVVVVAGESFSRLAGGSVAGSRPILARPERRWLGRGRLRPILPRSRAARSRPAREAFHRVIDPQGFHQCRKLAHRQIARLAQREAGKGQRTDADPAQPLDRDPDRLHHPAHEVVHAFVDGDRQDEALARFAENANLFRNDPLAFDHETIAHILQCSFGRPGSRQNVIFLGQAVFRMHDPVGEITVVGEQQQSFGVAVEPSHGIDAFGHVDETHHRPPVALILDGRDEAARLVEQEVARPLAFDRVAIDENDRVVWISFRAELGDDLAVDADAAGGDQFLGGASRSDASGRENALQAFHAGAAFLFRGKPFKGLAAGCSVLNHGPRGHLFRTDEE